MTTNKQSVELEDTARLVLMEQRDHGKRDMSDFANAMRDHHPGVALATIAELWRRYCGIDRALATHELDTGRPL